MTINTVSSASVNASAESVKPYAVIHESNGDISLLSYGHLVCQLRKGGLGFNRVVCLGRDWNAYHTHSKHIVKFLADNGVAVLADTRLVYEGIERGHARQDEAVAVLFDPTMY